MITPLKRALACSSLVALLAAVTCAQSALQDASGESSVFIKDGGGFARINPTDKSIDIGFLRDRGDERWYFGLDAKGKAGGNFASLFSGRTPAPEARLGFTLGKRFVAVDSDFRTIQKCAKTTAPELLANPPKLTPEGREQFVEKLKASRAPELLKEITQTRRDEIKQELLKRAKEDGASATVAELYAEQLADKRVAAEAETLAKKADERAEEEAKNKLAASGGLDPNAGPLDPAGADVLAKALCAAEDPNLIRRLDPDWLAFRFEYTRASYKLLNTGGAFADQIRKQNFDGFSATVAYNALITLDSVKELRKQREALRAARRNNLDPPELTPRESKGSVILGISLGVKRANNIDDLKSTDVEDQIFTSSSETTQRSAFAKQTVLRGDYKEYIAVPLNTDVVWYPGRFRSRIAFDFFTRSNLGSTDRKFVPGAGVFLTKEGKPTKVVGGISLAYDDGKARLGLVSGFHF
ncbi:MAG: hypothetical protein LC795_01870 [Acidobacteria bacterium]|nr:hypothetical protein [Acidobacteriota bacterium]